MAYRDRLQKRYKEDVARAKALAQRDVKDKTPEEIDHLISQWQKKFLFFEKIKAEIERKVPQLFVGYVDAVFNDVTSEDAQLPLLELVQKRQSVRDHASTRHDEANAKFLSKFFGKKKLNELKITYDAAMADFNKAADLLDERATLLTKASLGLVYRQIQDKIDNLPINVELTNPTFVLKRSASKQNIGSGHELKDFIKENANFPTLTFSGADSYRYVYQKQYLHELKKAIPAAFKQQNLSRLRAQAVTNSDAQRNLGSRFRTNHNFKKQLKIHSACPYCNQPFDGDVLESNVHLDHIYPVSKGGHSVRENLVFICEKCNSQKSDTTLVKFCADRSLDLRNVIKVLLRLGKDV